MARGARETVIGTRGNILGDDATLLVHCHLKAGVIVYYGSTSEIESPVACVDGGRHARAVSSTFKGGGSRLEIKGGITTDSHAITRRCERATPSIDSQSTTSTELTSQGIIAINVQGPRTTKHICAAAPKVTRAGEVKGPTACVNSGESAGPSVVTG